MNVNRSKLQKKSVLFYKFENFTKVVFFSGSVSAGIPYTDKWDYRYFVRCISNQLTDLLKITDWKYLLCTQEPPIFMDGNKPFSLYTPGKSIEQFKYKRNKKQEDELLRSISEWCGNETKLGEFWCSASINDFKKNLVTTLLEKEGRNKGPYYLKDPPDWAKKLSNSSSTVSRTELDSFINELVSKKLGFPVFSISDCNSFHTSGYLWGKYAIVSNPQPSPVAVLNFDSHSDLGDASTSYVRSDGWGAPLISDAHGCYISMDASGKFLVGSYNNGTDAKSVASGNVFTKDFWGNVNKNIKKDIKYVFISVDRDCLKDHLTQWKYVNPKTTISKLIETMDKVCKAITSACKEDVILIGFDVTGLPENQIMDTNAKTVFIANDGKHTDWDTIRGELQELLGWVKTAPLRPTSPQPSKPASTGGKAPTGKTPPARPTSPHPDKPASTDKPASKGKTPPARPTSPHPDKPASTDKPTSKVKTPPARRTQRQTRK